MHRDSGGLKTGKAQMQTRSTPVRPGLRRFGPHACWQDALACRAPAGRETTPETASDRRICGLGPLRSMHNKLADRSGPEHLPRVGGIRHLYLGRWTIERTGKGWAESAQLTSHPSTCTRKAMKSRLDLPRATERSLALNVLGKNTLQTARCMEAGTLTHGDPESV